MISRPTSWPESIARPIHRVRYFGDPRDDIWTLLRSFENAISLKRQIPLKKTWDEYGRAGFAISLAREHFEAAARAGVTARPLNLYYGALNFFKALGQLFAVRPTAVDWNRHGLQSIFDSPNVMMACAAIKPNGVFKLGYTSVPRAHFQIFGDIVDYAWTDDNAVSVEGASFSRLTNHEITLRDVFSRIPELGLHYFRALQARPRVMRGYVEYDNRGNDQFLVTYHVPLQTQGALRPDRKYANSLLNPATWDSLVHLTTSMRWSIQDSL
jgi:hypothetical protein